MIPEVPSYLGDDYIGNELVLDDKGGVKAGTLRALVVRLTQHGTAGESACDIVVCVPYPPGDHVRERRLTDRYRFHTSIHADLPLICRWRAAA
jgi:hypothetical protein